MRRYIGYMDQATLLLERLAALVHQSVRDDASRHGLLPIHVLVLSYLSRANRYSDLPIAIAEYFGITRGTVSQSIQVLERKALVLKRPDPRHGRRVHLELTEAGRAVLKASWTRRMEQVLDQLPQPQQPMTRALQDLLTGLQQLNGQRPFGICRGCAHFLKQAEGYRCGLTGEALAEEQTSKICREWTRPSGSPVP